MSSTVSNSVVPAFQSNQSPPVHSNTLYQVRIVPGQVHDDKIHQLTIPPPASDESNDDSEAVAGKHILSALTVSGAAITLTVFLIGLVAQLDLQSVFTDIPVTDDSPLKLDDENIPARPRPRTHSAPVVWVQSHELLAQHSSCPTVCSSIVGGGANSARGYRAVQSSLLRTDQFVCGANGANGASLPFLRGFIGLEEGAGCVGGLRGDAAGMRTSEFACLCYLPHKIQIRTFPTISSQSCAETCSSKNFNPMMTQSIDNTSGTDLNFVSEICLRKSHGKWFPARRDRVVHQDLVRYRCGDLKIDDTETPQCFCQSKETV